MKWIHYWVLLSANPWYKYGFLSFVATFVSLLVKLSSRPNEVKMQLEDWAVGLDLAQVSIFAVLTDGVGEVVHTIQQGKKYFDVTTVERLIVAPSLMFAMIVFLFFVVLLVRKHGWQLVGTEPTLNAWGAFAPLPVGLFYLAVAVLFLGGQ